MDRSGRLDSEHRGDRGRWQGKADTHWEVGRCDAGVGASGDVVCAVAREPARADAGFLSKPRHPRARAGGRDSEGRTVGGNHDRDRDRERAEQNSSAARSGDDRRDHVARQGAADRRAERKAAGGAPGGLFEVILPKDNEKDVAEVPENLRTAMKLHFVDTMDQVLAVALESALPQMAEDATAIAPIATPAAGEGPATHQ